MHILSHSHLWDVGEWNYSLISSEKSGVAQSKTLEVGHGQEALHVKVETHLSLKVSTQVEKLGKSTESAWEHPSGTGLRTL